MSDKRVPHSCVRDTVGKLSSELLKQQKEEISPIEQARIQLEEYETNLLQVAQQGKDTLPSKDFFLVVLTKKEKLMPNVLRNYFFFRNSCPTPDYDQTVYQYLKNSDAIEFLWTIPSKDTCHLLIDNKLQVAPEEFELLNFVLQFEDGTLYKLAKKLNGEKLNSKFVNELETNN